MDREKDQQIGADVNTTPQPSNGPLICVFSHSPHSVKFVSSFHCAHARVAPNSGQLIQGIQITQQTNNQIPKKEVEFPRKFLSLPHCFLAGSTNLRKFFTTLLAITRLLDF